MWRRRYGRLWSLILIATVSSAKGQSPIDEPPPVHPIFLGGLFNTRSDWRLAPIQGPMTRDYGANPAPGLLHLCLQSGAGGACVELSTPAAVKGWEAHYLEVAKPVYPQQNGPPLLMVVTASLHAGDGGQVRATSLFKYRRDKDVFERIYAQSTGTNNNQEVRFIPSGPLRGSVISAVPTEDPPFGYWVTVNRFAPNGYRQSLRYRSTTLYNDGNPLPVIDSETPGIELRLGIWKSGSPAPTPIDTQRACPKPELKRLELWCA